MPSPEPFLIFTRKLRDLRLRYMISGSVAAIFYALTTIGLSSRRRSPQLQFFREGGSGKHLRDIHRMLSALGEEWDRTTLTQMIAEHGLIAEWQRACRDAD